MSSQSTLLEFFKQATAALEHIHLDDDSVDNLSSIRQILLTKQTECLQTTIDTVQPVIFASVASLQQALRDFNVSSHEPALLTVQQAMEAMNEAARLAFCRLVLQSECIKNARNNDDHRGGLTISPLRDSDVLEFCGLCLAAIRLPVVRDHICRGTSLASAFSSPNGIAGITIDSVSATMVPRTRLDNIQRMFLRALGYDADCGMEELQRMFNRTTTKDTSDDGKRHDDRTLNHTFQNMEQEMSTFLAELSGCKANHGPGSATNDDPVTRVVSVTYSEKLIDATTGEEILTLTDNEAPRLETISQGAESESLGDRVSLEEQRERSENEMRVARQTAQLHSEILNELLAMPDEKRSAKLELARETVDQVLQTAVEIPGVPERISFMTTLNDDTQRLMAMHKIWSGMLAENGGMLPST